MRVSAMPADFLMTEVYTAGCPMAKSRIAALHMAADFPAAPRPACTPARSVASIMEASRTHSPPAEARVSAEAASTVVEGSTVVEAATLEAGDIDEHETGESNER
jgi:hypothetical protein